MLVSHSLQELIARYVMATNSSLHKNFEKCLILNNYL